MGFRSPWNALQRLLEDVEDREKPDDMDGVSQDPENVMEEIEGHLEHAVEAIEKIEKVLNDKDLVKLIATKNTIVSSVNDLLKLKKQIVDARVKAAKGAAIPAAQPAPVPETTFRKV